MSDYIKRESRTFIEIADDLNDLVTELNDKIVESIREKNADVVPVVRCKDCAYSETDDNGFYYCVHDIIGGYGMTFCADTFCSYGERRRR